MSLGRAIVLLSGGLDSSVNLYWAHRELNVVSTLTFNYGQRAAEREIESARKQSQKLGVPNKVLDIPWLKDLGESALTQINTKLPTGSDVQIDDFDFSSRTGNAVWVPNRNGIFLNIAAAFAESAGAEFVVPGFNKEEALTFPDNSQDYARSLDHGFSFSTKNHVKVRCFTMNMNKTEIAQKGRELDVDFSFVWPCYEGGVEICRQCESCQRYLRAMGG